MSSFGGLNIILNLDTIQFQNGLSKSDQETKKFVKQFEANFSLAQKKVREFSERTTQYLNNIENAANNINKTSSWNFKIDNFERIKSLATNFVEIADKSTELSNKLKLVTENEVQHAKAMADVYDISLKTAQSTQAVSAIYSSFSQNAKELRINQQQVASVTETISKAVAISGASTSEAQNSLTQFSQTLLMGKMRSQEYNSIMTQTPAVLQAIARGLGVTMGELKKMSDDGKLTTDKIIQGLEKSKTSVDELYSKTTTSVSGAMQNLQTATQKWVGELDTSLGVSDKAVKVTELLARHLDELAKTAVVVGVAYGSWKLSSVIQGQYNSIRATQAETTAKYEKLAALTQETQATYQTQLATYQSIQSKQADVVATQAQIQAEQAKLRILSLSATSYAERKAIQVELQALDRISAELTQKQTFLDQQQATAKKALSLAYRENAFAQSAFAASTKASGIAMTAFSAITAGVKAEMNALKVAMLSNPIMMGLTILTTASSLLYMFSSSTNEATEASLRYADSIDQVRHNLEQMTATQTAAELIKVKHSIEAQQESIANLREEQDKLVQQIETGINRSYDEMTGILFENKISTEDLANKKERLIIVTADLESEQNKLNRTFEWQRDLKAHIPIAELRDRFAELFPNIEQSKIKVDGLNIAIGNFTVKSPEMVIAAVNIANALGGVAGEAMKAAAMIANLSGMGINIGGNEIVSDKAQKYIDRLNKQTKISQLKRAGKLDEANKLQAELNLEGQEFTGLDYQKAFEAQLANLKESGIKTGGSPKKPKKTEAEKAAEKTRKNLDSWNSYFDELKRANADAVQSIALNEQRSIAELEKHLKTGVVKQQEAEMARTQIAQRYAKERAELVGRYVEKDQIKFHLDKSLSELDGLKQLGLIGGGDAKEAEMRLRLKYSQDVSQYAVSATDQVKGIYDPNQAESNRQTQELALLQSFNEQKLMTEEEYQQRKQAIIERYKNEQWQKEMSSYAEGLGALGSSFQQLANIVEQSASKQSSAYKTMFATAKAFSIAEATMNVYLAAAKVYNDWDNMTVAERFAKSAAVLSQGMTLVGKISGVGFATGGYTGDGGKFTPAGIVHKGEYVITKEATSRIGLDYLNYLNYGRRGFASGGGVAVPRVPSINHQLANNGETHNSVTVTVNIDKNGNSESSVEQQAQQGKQLGNLIQAKVLEVLSRERRAGGMLAH